MGVIFALIFFLSLLVIGVSGIIAGIVGLIIGAKAKKTGKTFSKALSVLFAVILSISIMITLIPAGFFSFIVVINSMPPDDFVETNIVIEENGYQDTRFTADGVVYEVLDFQVYNSNTISNPVFTYKTKGFLNGSQCGNYYKIPNNQGFHLISDGHGLLFCPVEEKGRINAYYSDLENLCGYYNDWDGHKSKLSNNETKSIYNFFKKDVHLLPTTQLVLNDAEKFEIALVCNEGLVYVESHCFLILNDKLYYVYDSDFADDVGIEYTLIEAPTEIATALFDIRKNS